MLLFFIGPSNSGKDTFYKLMCQEFSLNKLILYTTRPKRKNEVEGSDYYVIDSFKMNQMQKENILIERRDYNTVYGVWSYASSAKDIDIYNKDYLTLNTWEGYQKYINYYQDSSLMVPFYFQVDDYIRLKRALERERKNNGQYKEMCRRFLSDATDFDEKYLSLYNPIIINNNNSKEETYEQLQKGMKKVLKRSK